MRGHDEQTTHMFSYLSPEQRVPADHPLRAVRALTDEALQTMSRRFASLYATTGRPSIPPEQLLRALLLQVLYTVRSERLLMEELNDNLLFRWFVGLNMDDPVWHPTTFTKNRDRLLSGDVAAAFFDAVQAHARAAGRLSDEHFTVDGTQLEAWASLKSFRCVDAAESDPPEDPGNPTVNFHGERRRNDTHQSTTDPEAMLHRKGQGKEAQLAYLGHVLLDNRQGRVANVCATHATGTAERDAAVLLLEASASPGSTVGADKGYDGARFVADVRVQDVTPHVAQKVRGSAIDGRTTRHAGYHVSQRKRTLVEQVFGWMKTVGGLRKLRHRGIALVDWQLTFAATAYNVGPVAESGGEVSLIAGRGCRWPPRRDSVSPCAPLSGGRDTHDGHENSPILVFFSNLLGVPDTHLDIPCTPQGADRGCFPPVHSSSLRVHPCRGRSPRNWDSSRRSYLRRLEDRSCASAGLGTRGKTGPQTYLRVSCRQSNNIQCCLTCLLPKRSVRPYQETRCRSACIDRPRYPYL